MKSRLLLIVVLVLLIVLQYIVILIWHHTITSLLILVKNWTKGVSRVWELENSLFYNFVNYSFSNYVKIKTPLIAVNGVLLCILTINLVWNTSIFCDTFI